MTVEPMDPVLTGPSTTVAGPATPAAPARRRSTRWPASRWAKFIPMAILIVLAVTGPWWVPFDPEKVIGGASIAPGGDHLFGTDASGLDVFSRVIVATRTNLLIALTVAVLATLIGCVFGLLIGMNESSRGPLGFVARACGRAVDLTEAVPAVLTGLVVVSFFGASATTLTGIMSVILSPIQIRLVRTEVLRVRNDAYLDAARMAGLSEFGLTVRHVLPNSAWAALQNMSVIFAVSIIVTAALGFIGVGLPPPAPEWGSMLNAGAGDVISGRWWAAAFPALFLFFAVAAAALASQAIFGKRRTAR
ncbi:ABC transporter permease [Nakamurella leprariae]|uniref:ABC transporter permease n=1 Tax=Nakamurella leprariae TaxID=2803911 RepID=A0A938YJK0_9ACTN|nr:ABC transporter permease [Nakamurella leprariae]MBM9469462.1 ABC transporter permease [Nakamurella leprariae]